jgi:hypothetical protein
MANKTGKGGFKPGVSGNPGGRAKKAIGNLGLAARQLAGECLETLTAIMRGEIKGVTPRDRLAAAMHLLDRGYGKPTQAIDLIMLGKKISELSTAELIELNSRLVTTDTAGDAAKPEQETLN